jgi:predicted MFS family arabinose efflux permease
LKVTQTLSFCLSLTLGLLVSFDVIRIWHILLLTFFAGTVNAFDQPTRQALLPDLVPREDLTNAIALNSSAWQGSALFGPTLAGAMVAWVGIAGAFYADAISFLAVVLALFMMRGVPERSSGGRHRGVFDDLAEGLRYVGRTRLLLTLLVLATITNIFGRSYQQLLPIFAGDVLHVGSSGLGLMLSMPGAGTLLGAVLLGALGDIERKGVVLFGGMAAFSVILVLFTLTRSFPIALGLLFLGGVASIVFSTMLTTMLQLNAPAHMMGRIMSLLTVTMQGFTPIGALLSGSLATGIGTPAAVALSAVVVGLAALLAAGGAPSVRRFSHVGEAA